MGNPTHDELTRRYGAMPGDELIRLAVNAAGELTADAAEVLRAELQTRGLDERLHDVVAVQTRPLEAWELDELVRRAQGLPCPLCGSADVPLTAAVVSTVKSVLFVSACERRVVVGCPRCITAAAEEASTITAGLGWWALPLGPVHTIQALILNAKAHSKTKQQRPSVEFTQFVMANRGAVLLQLQEQSGSPGGRTRG